LRKIIVAVMTAALLAGGAGAAFAGPENGKAGPNGHNDYGLCTAASHGNKNGWTDGALPPPFAGAPDGSDAGSDPGGRQDFIDAFCDPFPTPGGK
jgi:hypothetical protein